VREGVDYSCALSPGGLITPGYYCCVGCCFMGSVNAVWCNEPPLCPRCLSIMYFDSPSCKHAICPDCGYVVDFELKVINIGF